MERPRNLRRLRQRHPLVASPWILTEWRVITTSTGFVLDATTDTPTHLWLFYQCVPPTEHPVYKRLRGINYRCGSTWTYDEAIEEEQAQAGNTTHHAFGVNACDCGEPIYFFLSDTQTQTASTHTTGGLQYDLEDCDMPVPAVKVHKTGDQTLTNNVFATVVWGATDYEIGDWQINLAAGTVTVPEDGAYIIHAHLIYQAFTTGERTAVVLSIPNTLDYAKVANMRPPQVAGTLAHIQPTNQVYLNKSDVIRVSAWQNRGGNCNLTNQAGLFTSLALVKIPGT